MNRKEIKSLQHPIVKSLVKLRTDKHVRFQTQSLLLEGRKMISEYQGKILTLLTTSTSAVPTHLVPENHFFVSPEIIKKITGLQNPEPIVAQIPYPKKHSIDNLSPILALDRIRDPGNLGTLIRSACAFGFKGVFLVDCSDPYSTKSIRSAKGSSLAIPIEKGTEYDLLAYIKKNALTSYIADASGGNLTIHNKSRVILILGNESTGVSSSLKSGATILSIPMTPKSDSLNVAIAGGILMHTIQEA